MIAIVVLGLALAVVYNVMTTDERARARRYLVMLLRWMREYGRREMEPFRQALRERTPTAIVTPVLLGLNALVFICVVLTAGSSSEPATLLRWGASYGPRTTNGEWWRLVSAAWVHDGVVALAINTTVLVQLGFLLERLIGGFPFAAAYGSAAILSAVTHLWASPMTVGMGASGAICGLYGLLLAELSKGLTRSYGTIPIVAARRLAPVTVAFALFNLVDPSVSILAELAGLAAGLVFGYLVVGDVQQQTPPRRRVGVALASALTLAIIVAVPLRGIIDIRPEIQRLVDLERHTMDAYETSVRTVKKNGNDIDAVVRLIETKIVPAFREADERLKAIRGVPRDDQWRIADALEYLRLRSESWELRAHGLRATSRPVAVSAPSTVPPIARSSAQAAAQYRSTLLTLGQAEAAERTALRALDRIKT